jgi:nucleotide-binding universal stress UspA family protein
MQTENTLPRIEYRKILYATDLSEAGRYAFPYAASIAQRFDADLTVFHVLDERDFERDVVGYISEDFWKDLKTRELEEAKQILIARKRDDVEITNAVDQFCKDTMSQHHPDKPIVSYDVVVEAGDPVEEVLREAHTGGYDLVVVSKHGHGSVQDAVMGDTVRRILRRCKVPVLVVPLPE